MTQTTTAPDQETAELVNLMDSRAQTYGFLARLFRIEVDQKLFDEMRAMRFPTATGNAHVDKGYELIYTYLKNGWSESILDLARDYVRVFIGHGMNGHSAAYPYESVHTSEKRLMMQEARAEVLQVYRANELKKDQSWREGEDHIAVELEFMQIMCLRTAESLRAGDEDGAIGLLKTQYAFVQDHLLNWVPLLVADMLHFSETELYRGLAELTLGFVQTEAEILEDLLQGVDEADRG
jgi:TorA-specific chaperone